MLTHFISYTETHEFFQVELLSLLVSLIVSLLLSSSFPYFFASGLCLLTTASSLIFELYRHVSGQHSYLEATTTLTFAVITFGTFIYALFKRLSNVELRWHTITALGFWSYLALRAVWILEDTARPIHLDVSRSVSATTCPRSHISHRSTSAALKQLDSRRCT